MLRRLLVALMVFPALPAAAASPAEILEWTQAGVPEADIIARIRKDPGLPVSADDVLRLRAAGVSDEVLRALVNPSIADPPKSEPIPEPIAPTRVIRTVDDIIKAHAEGVSNAELEVVVRELQLRILRLDRERMLLAGVPEAIIKAASFRPRITSAATTREAENEFGASGTTTIELAGGFGSTVGESSLSSGRLVVGLHRLLGSFVAIGTELEATFGTGGVGRALWFGTLGFEAPSKALLVRAVARVGAGADGVAYGAQFALLGRAGRLLAGANFNATWTGDPIVTILGLDLRIGTWF